MVWVKSRLVQPTGYPIEGQCVSARLMVAPTWLATAQAQVLGRTVTNTNAEGVWRLNLLPYTDFEEQIAGCVYYQVDEGGGKRWNIRVPPVEDPATELWMRDLVLDVPTCPEFIGINRLARLQDVDTESVVAAKPGDFLVLLPSGRWGASHGPLPLAVAWTPNADNTLAVDIIVAGFGGGGAKLGFGDGSEELLVTSSHPITHTYAAPGTYILTATDVNWPAFTGTAKVGTKDHLPRAYPYLDGDDDWRVLLWLDEDADDTKYTIDWGDGSPLEEVKGQNHGRVPPRPRVGHIYTEPGRYTLLITDLSTRRQITANIEIGDEIGVVITYDDPLRPRTEFRWLATGATWEFQSVGSAPDTGIVPASGIVTRPASHDLPPGDFQFEIREVVGTEARRRAVRRLVQPSQWDWRMDVVISWRDHADPLGRQTVTVTARGARTACTVEWGDGAASEVVAPNTPISHQYTLPAPALGWRLRLVETGVEEPRTWSRVLGEPRYVGTPTMSARTNGAVDLHIEGVDQLYNDDWYSVAWELGAGVDLVAAVGRWYPANHIYSAPGHKTIVVDGPGMAAPVTREVDVVMYPSPMVTVTEAVDGLGNAVDPDRRTARISVDNTASGGPCTVRPGDGSAPRPCAPVDSFLHKYPPGRDTYWIIATSDADPTAKGRTAVNMPFGTARTLYYDLTGEPDSYAATVTITAKDPAKTARVRWEDGGTWQTVPPSNTISRTYPPVEDTYMVTVAYEDGSESWPTALDMPWPPATEGARRG